MKWCRHLLIALITTVVMSGPAAHAQPTDKVHRIGVLGGKSGPEDGAFHERLQALGWSEGRNLVIEYRWSGGQNERLPGLAADLVRLGVEVIEVDASPYVEPARQATSTIPIVFCSHGDPVGTGHVASLARPGGNVTGIANAPPELYAKQLELLTQAIPGAQRIAVLWNPPNPSNRAARPAVDAAARNLRVELHWVSAELVDELEAAFAAMGHEHADAVLALLSPLTYINRARAADLALQHRLPGLLGWRASAEAGSLLGYGPTMESVFRRCAEYVDKILKGAKPADLPVEQASIYELVVNLKTARALGIQIPPEILARADEVIE
jgi:putative tryptophan/tyrosine transport system substrate-binding protein